MKRDDVTAAPVAPQRATSSARLRMSSDNARRDPYRELLSVALTELHDARRRVERQHQTIVELRSALFDSKNRNSAVTAVTDDGRKFFRGRS